MLYIPTYSKYKRNQKLIFQHVNIAENAYEAVFSRSKTDKVRIIVSLSVDCYKQKGNFGKA